MGEVYRARDVKLNREVALKVLPEAFTRDPERLARFKREAQVLASLNHPNIAAIYGFEESNPSVDSGQGAVQALVLELVEGETLAERVAASALEIRAPGWSPARGARDRGGLPIGEALRIARQIADALEAAHERGIVHRDLKPENIKITTAGVVKVLDFGLAKIGLSEAAGHDLSLSPTMTAGATGAGMILGTAAYMSPEQARGKVVDKRTDIWAFGCVLYEMLTGRAAFARETVSDTIAAILEREPDWTLLPAALPADTARLLRRCLDKDPHRRLRDVADARADLDEAKPHEGPSVATPSGRRLSQPNQIAWSLGGVLVVAIATAIAVLSFTSSSATAERVPVLSRPVKVTNSAAHEFGPAISPDGKWVAYYANTNGRSDVWVKFLESGATSNLTANLGLDLPARTGIGAIGISPDGSQIAFLARAEDGGPSYDTWVIPAPVGGPPRKLFQVLQACQWSPDGASIMCVRPASTKGDALVVANRDGTGVREVVPQRPGRHVHWPAWSADGRHIYFIHTYDNWHNEPSEIFRVATSGGEPEPVVRSARRAIYPVPLPGGDLMFAGNPETVDLGLWWKGGDANVERPLTVGLGEYAEPRLSADGRKLVATLVTPRQLLVTVPVTDRPSTMRVLTDGYGSELDPSFDPRTDRLVFSSARSGHRSLWAARADGTDAKPLTVDSAIDERPMFSPDGQQIAFISDRGGRRAIWVMSANGGAPKKLVETPVLDNLTWSLDGRRVIFARPEDDRTGLASVSVADGAVAPIPTPADGCCPAASPVADTIAYLQPTMVAAAGPSGSPAARLWLRFVDGAGRRLYEDMPDQQFANGFLAWSPDGKRLAAAAVTNGRSEIWIVEPGGRQPYRKILDFDAASRPRGFTWNRDGSTLIISNQEFPGDIVMFDVMLSN
jgi:serine/threonine protein kinase